MTMAVSTLIPTCEFWISEKEQSSNKVSINNYQFSEPSFQKLKKIDPKALTFANTHFTKPLSERLLEILGDLRSVKELRFINCTMRDEHAEIFAFSKEKVIFEKCLLTHLYDKSSADKETIDLGILNIGDEVAIFKPDLIELGEESSEISEDLRKKIDAPDRTLKIEEDDEYNSLIAEQVQLAMRLIHSAREFVLEIGKHFDRVFPRYYPTNCVNYYRSSLLSLADTAFNKLNLVNKVAFYQASKGISCSKEQLICQLNLITKSNEDLETEIAQCKDDRLHLVSTGVGSPDITYS